MEQKFGIVTKQKALALVCLYNVKGPEVMTAGKVEKFGKSDVQKKPKTINPHADCLSRVNVEGSSITTFKVSLRNRVTKIQTFPNTSGMATPWQLLQNTKQKNFEVKNK